MDALRQYIISVVAASVLCGILTGILHNGTAKELIKLLCGAFLAITLLRPVLDLKKIDLSDLLLSCVPDASQTVALGESHSREALCGIIKAETEAYILDKAEELGLSLEVEVALSDGDTPVPASVRLSGDAAPAARQQLETVLTKELGIQKENQLWIG